MNTFWLAVDRGIVLSLAAAIVWFSYSIICKASEKGTRIFRKGMLKLYF